jgi:dihydrofolate reductase
MEMGMRNLIAAMKTSVDAKVEGSEGFADWVEGWSDDYGLMPQVDACVLGAGMYRGYEPYWTAIQNEPNERLQARGEPGRGRGPNPLSGMVPTPAEVEWARFAAQTPHYVLSSTLNSAQWPHTSFVRGLEEIAALKQQAGKDIYLMGGALTTASLIDAGLVDELRLIVYPLIAGEGRPLFQTAQERRGLELRKVEQLHDGRLSLIYAVG